MLFSKYRLLYEKGWIKGAIKTARGFHQKEIKYPLHFNLSKSQERELDIWINRQGYLVYFYDDVKIISWHQISRMRVIYRCLIEEIKKPVSVSYGHFYSN